MPVAVGDAAFAGVYLNTAWDEPLTLTWQGGGLHFTAPWYGFDGVLAPPGKARMPFAGETDLRAEIEPGSADDHLPRLSISRASRRASLRIATGTGGSGADEEYVGTYASASQTPFITWRRMDICGCSDPAPDSPLTRCSTAICFPLDDWGCALRNAAGMVDSFALTAKALSARTYAGGRRRRSVTHLFLTDSQENWSEQR